MKVLESYKSRRYLLRMLLSVSVIVVAILVFSSSVLHYSAENRVLKMQVDSNYKTMNQIRTNIGYTNELISSFAINLYSDLEIQPLLLHPDRMSAIQSIIELNKAQTIFPFLHSILIYNGHVDETFAAGELAAGKPEHGRAAQIVDLLKSENKLPGMQLIPMNFSGRPHTVDFFSFPIYETYYDRNDKESVLVLNVKPEWIFNNMRASGSFAAPDRSGIYMMDGSGQIVMSENQAALGSIEELREAVFRHGEGNGEAADSGYFIERIGDDSKFFVTHMKIGIGDWKVVSVQPYDAVLGGVDDMRKTSLLVIVAFFVLSIAVSVFLAHRLYRPVEKMMLRIRTHALPEAAAGSDRRTLDELSYATNVYDEIVEKWKSAAREQDSRKTVVRKYFLRRVLQDSASIGREEWAESAAENGLAIAAGGAYRVAVVRVDQYTAYRRETSAQARALHLFAIANIAEELLLAKGCACESADMRGDHLAMLISSEDGAEMDDDALAKLFATVQDVVGRYYKVSLSVSLGDSFTDYAAIAEQYEFALQNGQYKFIFGDRAVIVPSMVQGNNERLAYAMPADLEKKLAESIRTNELKAMENGVAQLLAHISTYHYDQMIHGMLQLLDLFNATIRDINKHRVMTVKFDLGPMRRQLLELETMRQTETFFRELCQDIHEKLKPSEQEKNDALMDTIKEIIEAKYNDNNLSLQSIATMLHLSSAYVGRIFKQSECMALGQYINEVRLRRAKEFLETKNYNVKEIMELVGYANESTYFKLFKKKYGVTPKEYRLKRNLE
ncbi:AraC family transcriptional regulator [Cohnella sp. GCM10027633]|uniref:AraC family transcriptional regulator n=1 Tax=unclassified Cohnella TaxID=2636738 RepID=UPI00362D62EC